MKNQKLLVRMMIRKMKKKDDMSDDGDEKNETDVTEISQIINTVYEEVDQDEKEFQLRQQQQQQLKSKKSFPLSSSPFSSSSSSSKKGNVSPLTSPQCTICYTVDFDKDTPPVVMTNCRHAIICNGCFLKYIQIKCRDKEILPWISCPAAGCKSPLHPNDIIRKGITLDELYVFMFVWFSKTLARVDYFVECITKGCGYGFLLEETPKLVDEMGLHTDKDGKETKPKEKEKEKEKPKKIERKCEVCLVNQVVEKKKEELDEEFKKMIKEGKLRECPKCKHFTFKEYGVCNVIECAKCGIHWNWKTRDTGKSAQDLKEKARQLGTLWEPGELAFQQKLERDNPEEFKKLLARNGVQYKANYVRGT